MVPLELSDRPHPARDARAVRDLGRLVGGADVVHAHGLRAAAVAVLAVGRAPVPVVATLHNAAPSGRAHRCRVRRAGAGRGAAQRPRARASRPTSSSGCGGSAPAAPGSPSWPRPRAARRCRDRYAVRADLGVGGAHRARRRRGPARPAEGARPAARRAPRAGRGEPLDLVTVVAGDGPLREPLQARIDAEHLPVRLLGHRDDVPDLLAAADVVVSSAVWEGQPVGIQEALHAGAAVVATDVGGTGAVVGDAALLVPPADPVSLSRAIRDVVVHGARARQPQVAGGRAGRRAADRGRRPGGGARGLPLGAPGGVRGLNTGPRDGNRRVGARVGSGGGPA